MARVGDYFWEVHANMHDPNGLTVCRGPFASEEAALREARGLSGWDSVRIVKYRLAPVWIETTDIVQKGG